MPWTDDSDPGPWREPPADAPAKDHTDTPARKPDRGRAASGPWDKPGESTDGRGRPSLLGGRPPPDGPRRNRQGGPDLQRLSRSLTRVAAQAIGRGRQLRLDRRLAIALAGVVVAAWFASGIFEVGPDETAVVTRLGAVIGEDGPGLAYHWPAPFEQARVVSTERIEGLGGEGAPMLTRDDMLVQPSFVVRWRAADPIRYVGATDVADQMRTEALRALRRAIGRSPMEALQGAGLAHAQAEAAGDLQAALDRLGLGLAVVSLDLRGAAPAPAAADAFRQVEDARQSVHSDLAQAAAYRDRAVDAARAEAERTVRAAGAYSEQAAREAAGEAARFALLDAEYRRYPDVTRQRLYTEMMEHVLRASNKVVVEPGKGEALTLPPELFKSHSTPDTAALPPSRAPSGAAPSPPAS